MYVSVHIIFTSFKTDANSLTMCEVKLFVHIDIDLALQLLTLMLPVLWWQSVSNVANVIIIPEK